ncbi:MAG: VOC family protein [Acidimicrobiia bacterium]|nr:VOC family protein [Acidimicrobiia bacterium]NNJ48702.1 VOC family protein [Acidimicrobiia bacterium]
MQMQTIVYVTDMDRSIEFYERLGFAVDYRGGPVWTAFRGTDGVLALHTVDELPAPGRVALSLVADDTLEKIVVRLARHGVEASSIETQPFGRSTVVQDPDGLPIQINEHAPD